MLSWPRRRTVDPIQNGRNLQYLAPGLKKIVLENLRPIARFLHETCPPTPI
jgi:hypothetical protein